jgi:hypothetical protein
MRFMLLHKAAGDAALVAEDRHAVEAYHAELTAAGALRAREDLHPGAAGARLSFSGRQPMTASARTLPAVDLKGFTVIDVASRDEAIAWAKRWPVPAGGGEVEIEVREGGCPGGVPTVARAKNAAGNDVERYIVLLKADAQSEAGSLPDQQRLAAMTRRNEESVAAGMMIAGEGLQPSARGARVRLSGGRPSVIDGPFAEAKELVAGYWMLEVRSMDEALDWVRAYPFPFDDAEIEVRPVQEITHAAL